MGLQLIRFLSRKHDRATQLVIVVHLLSVTMTTGEYSYSKMAKGTQKLCRDISSQFTCDIDGNFKVQIVQEILCVVLSVSKRDFGSDSLKAAYTLHFWEST